MKEYEIQEDEPMMACEPAVACSRDSVAPMPETSIDALDWQPASRPADDPKFRERLKQFIRDNFPQETYDHLASVNFMFDAKTPWDYDTETDEEFWARMEREETEGIATDEYVTLEDFKEHLDIWKRFK